MPRVKRGVTARARHKKVLALVLFALIATETIAWQGENQAASLALTCSTIPAKAAMS